MGPDHAEEHDAGYDWRRRFPGHHVAQSAEGGVLASADDDEGAWLIADEGTMADLLDEQDRRGLVKVLRFASREDRDAELAARALPRHGTPGTSGYGSQLTEAESVRMDLEMRLLAAARESLEQDGIARPGGERDWGDRLARDLRALPGVTSADDDVTHAGLRWRWTRPPGRFDLVWAVADGQGAAELKIRKPGELIWDLVKLADHAGFDEAAFRFAAICVQVEPSDLTRGSGALLAGTFSGVQRPRDWVERWPADWRSLMCGGKGIRPTSLPQRVHLGEPSIVGSRAGTHWRIVPIAGVGEDEPRDELDAWGWPDGLGARPDGWRSAVAAAEAPRGNAKPQKMIDCAGYAVPARFRRGQARPWLAEHYPRMTPGQRQELTRILRRRRWTDQEFTDLLPTVDPPAER